jgi:hypothetical protein
MKYIHYGHKHFDRNLFVPVRNQEIMTKPEGGFWGSPVDAEWGWADWCRSEKFRKCDKANAFIFTLRENANVLKWRTVDDVHAVPQIESQISIWICPDFEALRRDGVDAIEVEINELYFPLYGWDCDSILVMNPNIIMEEQS